MYLYGLETATLAGFCNLFSQVSSGSQQAYLVLFYSIVFGIQDNFMRLNKILNHKILKKKQNSENLNDMKYLAQLYLEIYHVTQLTNQIFSVPIMFMFGYNTLSAVFSLYELLSVIFIADINLQHIGICVVINSWLPSAIIASILIIKGCMMAESKANETKNILRKVLCTESAKKRKKMLRIFIMQVRHLKPTFSCGLFVFNWDLLGMVKFGNTYNQ